MSGHQVRSKDPSSQNICGPVTATVFESKLCNLHDFNNSLVPTIRISRNFDIDVLGSGHFLGPSIINLWGKGSSYDVP